MTAYREPIIAPVIIPAVRNSSKARDSGRDGDSQIGGEYGFVEFMTVSELGRIVAK